MQSGYSSGPTKKASIWASTDTTFHTPQRKGKSQKPAGITPDLHSHRRLVDAYEDARAVGIAALDLERTSHHHHRYSIPIVPSRP
jgi:hypothetical protein